MRNGPRSATTRLARLAGGIVRTCFASYFGIELGPHAWYLSANVLHGSVTGNTVTGAKIQINAEGAGTAAKPMTVSGNTLGPTPAELGLRVWPDGNATVINVSPNSIVTTTVDLEIP